VNKLPRTLFQAGLLLCLLAAGVSEIAGQTASWQWRELTPSSGIQPDARRNGAAIYDPVAKRFIIFGGTGNTGTYNDTWAFDLAAKAWTRLDTTGTTPAPRLGFDAVYDVTGHQMVIYAGQGTGFFNDTWTLNLNTLEWRNVSPAASARPKARYGSASIYDPVSRSLVQFAGFTEESRRFQDTQSFSLDSLSWQDWTPAGAKPEVRCLLTAAFDRNNRRMLIYGGQRSGFLDDLWAFDLAARTWENLTISPRPSGRLFTSAFVDRDGHFVVFGGSSASGYLNELQSFNLQSRQWTRLAVPNPPSPRNGSQAAYIESENRFIVFGGLSDRGVLNDVWELSTQTTTPLTTVSAASYEGQTLAAESIVAAFGTDLAPVTQAASSTPLPATLAGTAVKVKDSLGTERAAPLFFVSPTQVNYLLPQGTAPGTAVITLTGSNGRTAVGEVTIASVAPSIFSAAASGRGLAAAYTLRLRGGTQLTEPVVQWDAALNRFFGNPIDVGVSGESVFLVLFGTGFRARSALSSATVRIGGMEAQVNYAGVQGDFVGLDQMNVVIPPMLAGRGEVDVAVMIDGRAANTVQIHIK
jgi:uncharacterized protein (TIGR03437 family)